MDLLATDARTASQRKVAFASVHVSRSSSAASRLSSAWCATRRARTSARTPEIRRRRRGTVIRLDASSRGGFVVFERSTAWSVLPNVGERGGASVGLELVAAVVFHRRDYFCVFWLGRKCCIIG
jgi:hypothetical protein